MQLRNFEMREKVQGVIEKCIQVKVPGTAQAIAGLAPPNNN